MNIWSRLFACLALTGLAFGAIVSAQDKEKDGKKDEKKDEKKVEKKVGKKSDDTKSDEKGKDTVEEKLVYGQIIGGKIKRFATGGGKDIVLDIYMPDPKKMYDFKLWQAQQFQSIATARNFYEKQQRQFSFQKEMARRQSDPTNTMSVQEVEVRAPDILKVRSLYPPTEYNDKGEIRKWSAKELSVLKAGSKLPGYPSEYESLRPGHFVQAYLAKMDMPKAGGAAKKKLDDDMDLGAAKPEVVMIVITGEPTGR